MSSFFESLKQENPTTVSLAPGDAVVGKYVRLDSGPTQQYGDVPILVFSGVEGEYHTLNDEAIQIEEDGIYGLWLFHKALITQLQQLRPEKGETVGIYYKGKRKALNNGREYHDYTVRVDRAKPAEWDSINIEANEE